MHLELKKLVFDKCMTLRQFSQQSGIPYPTVHALANNKRQSVQLSTINRICIALGCAPGDLIKLD